MLKLFKNISIYSFGSMLNSSISFLLLPLYTRILQPADYGKLELVYLLASIFLIFYGFRVESGYSRIYFFDKMPDFRKKLFGTAQSFTLFCSLILLSIVLMNATWISREFLNFEEGKYFLKLIAIIAVVEVMTFIPINNIRMRQKPKLFVLVNLFKLIVVSSLTVFFLAFASYGVEGVLLARLIGNIVTLILLYIVTWGEFILAFSASQLKLMLGFSLFLIPSNLSSIVLNMSNRYFLQESHTLDDVGLYSLGAKLAMIIPILFTEPVKQAFGPYLFEKIDSPIECKKTLVDFSKVFFIGLSVVVLSISIFAPEIVSIVASDQFAGSHSIVFVLAMSNMFLGLAGIVVLGIHITRKTWVVTVIWLASAVVNVILNISLIPIYGRMGAAWATFISVVIITLLYLFAIHKLYPVKFPYFVFVEIMALVIFFYSVSTYLAFNIYANIALKVGIMLLYFVSLFLARIVDRKQISMILGYFKTRISTTKQS